MMQQTNQITQIKAVPEYAVEFAGQRGRRIAVEAGSQGVWRWHFRCGDRAINPGGGVQLFCEVPKFWLATIVQTEDPDRSGYLKVSAGDDLIFELVNYQKNWKELVWATVRFPKGMQFGQELTVAFGSEPAPCYAVAHKYFDAPIS